MKSSNPSVATLSCTSILQSIYAFQFSRNQLRQDGWHSFGRFCCADSNVIVQCGLCSMLSQRPLLLPYRTMLEASRPMLEAVPTFYTLRVASSTLLVAARTLPTTLLPSNNSSSRLLMEVEVVIIALLWWWRKTSSMAQISMMCGWSSRPRAPAVG